jgi:hypothetical protein
MRHDDPGREWTEALLDPLRRARIEVDVAPAVMARLAAERGAPGALPGLAAATWRTGLAWTASFAFGVLALGVLAATIYTLATRGEALPESVAVLRSFGRMGETLAGVLAGLTAGMAAAAAPILRGVWAVLQTAAPLVRGAGLVTALCGALSIAISLYVFAQARRNSPVTAMKGELE